VTVVRFALVTVENLGNKRFPIASILIDKGDLGHHQQRTAAVISRLNSVFLLCGLVTAMSQWTAASVPACAPCPPPGKPVLNADQTVIIIWDATTKTEHFIRRASFHSEADAFGFVVPTPSEPELSESGNATFPYLQSLTEPERKSVPRPQNVGCSCGEGRESAQPRVRVLQEKLVAGFNAAVLEASSSRGLADWLKKNGYALSPEIEAWAKPYVEADWKFTALRIAKSTEQSSNRLVDATALRMTFKTERPLFPYREPEVKLANTSVETRKRLLRIYFLADGRYDGTLSTADRWTGQVAWANQLKPEERERTLNLLNLPDSTGPAQWWLTEFEDPWPYRKAPSDLYFTRSSNKETVNRPPLIQYVSSGWPTDITAYAVAVLLILPPVYRRTGRGRRPRVWPTKEVNHRSRRARP
jgi:hypothetical protein